MSRGGMILRNRDMKRSVMRGYPFVHWRKGSGDISKSLVACTLRVMQRMSSIKEVKQRNRGMKRSLIRGYYCVHWRKGSGFRSKSLVASPRVMQRMSSIEEVKQRNRDIKRSVIRGFSSVHWKMDSGYRFLSLVPCTDAEGECYRGSEIEKWKRVLWEVHRLLKEG